MDVPLHLEQLNVRNDHILRAYPKNQAPRGKRGVDSRYEQIVPIVYENVWKR